MKECPNLKYSSVHARAAALSIDAHNAIGHFITCPDFSMPPGLTVCSFSSSIRSTSRTTLRHLLTTSTMADNVEAVLSKIRPHTSSALAHQKAPATLLRAIEATFREQNTEPSATAYFATLLTTLDGALQSSGASGPAMGEADVVPAVLYLLAAVVPCVPHPVIRSNLPTTLSLTTPLFSALSAFAPPLRSQITLYGAILHALDRSDLDVQGLRQAFMTILQFTLDPRPKVRKKAAEVVKDVLSAPPLPMAKHPYAEKVAEWVKAALTEISSGGIPKFKGKKADTEGSEAAVHLLAFLRPVLPTLPTEVSFTCYTRNKDMLIFLVSIVDHVFVAPPPSSGEPIPVPISVFHPV